MRKLLPMPPAKRGSIGSGFRRPIAAAAPPSPNFAAGHVGGHQQQAALHRSKAMPRVRALLLTVLTSVHEVNSVHQFLFFPEVELLSFLAGSCAKLTRGIALVLFMVPLISFMLPLFICTSLCHSSALFNHKMFFIFTLVLLRKGFWLLALFIGFKALDLPWLCWSKSVPRIAFLFPHSERGGRGILLKGKVILQ